MENSGTKNKIKKLEDLLAEKNRLKEEGKTIVFTNGVFDLLNPKHIEFLEKAKELGDILIVGINSDASVREIKGPKRPIIEEGERALMLASLFSVDYVIIFNEIIPLHLVDAVKPDVYVKGGDYKREKILEYEGGLVEKYGGKFVLIPRIGKPSTTDIIDRIIELHRRGSEERTQVYKKLKTILQKIDESQISHALELMSQNNVLLIGDFIIDAYTYCTAIGKTSKTPTISVKKGKTEYFWGGSGLFAKNLTGLGAKVNYITICGNDWGKKYITDENPVENLQKYILVDEKRPTTIKERIWADNYKVLQLDTLENFYIGENTRKAIEEKITGLIDWCDFVIISDSRHGMMSPELIAFVRNICREKNKILIADTQISNRTGNFKEYFGVDMFSLNETEARSAADDERSDIKDVLDKLYRQTNIRRLILKRGEKGIIGYDNGEFFEMPAIPVDVVDPIGAGDAFLSAASLTFKPEIPLIVSMFIAVCAASLSIAKMGTIANNIAELKEFVEKQVKKIYEN